MFQNSVKVDLSGSTFDSDLLGQGAAECNLLAAELQDDRAERQAAVATYFGAGGDAETEQLSPQLFIGDVGYTGVLALTKLTQTHNCCLLGGINCCDIEN
jgi:hypothetical protein